jgi:serine/threonine protein kinase/CHASE1-domain containing sensor protein
MGSLGKGRFGVVTRSFLPSIAALLIGGASTLGAFIFVRQQERSHHQLVEQRRAADATSAIFLALQVPVEAALTLPAFLNARGVVTQAEFDAFAKPLLERHRSLKKLQWAVRVPDADRAGFESRWRITIRQPDAEGKMVTAPTRPEYYPILYIAPDEPTVAGFDVAYDQARRSMLERAVTTGRVTLSPRFRLIEDPADAYSVAVNAPLRRSTEDVDREEILGVGAAIFQPQVVVSGAVDELLLDGMQFVLRDASSQGKDVLFSHPAGVGAEWDTKRVPEDLQYTRDFNYLDRRWTIQWRWEPPSGRTAWLTLGFGALITLLAAGLIALRSMMTNLRSEIFAAQRLGNYRLGRKLGEGGMGTVYLAHHAFLRRPTAVKVIRLDPTLPELSKRFEREARYTSRLTHPNTISVYDYGETELGVFYYAMEYVQGVTLRDLVKTCGPLPVGRVRNIMSQVAGSLSEAHARGILHRDIKPENVMISERGGIPDFVKVLDFGLVKDATASVDSSLSTRVALLGTPGYIAPETITDATAFTPASDVYSMGALLYFLVTAKRVHQAGSRGQVLKLALEQDPAVPSKSLELPADWEQFMVRCLDRDPRKRPEDARAFRRELHALTCPTQYSEAEALEWWGDEGAAMLSKMNASDEDLDGAPTDLAPARSSIVKSRSRQPRDKKRSRQSAT